MAVDRECDDFLLDAYTGKNGFADGSYLVAHPRESDTKYDNRQELAVYPNFCRKISDIYLGFLWKRTPSRETDDLYVQFSGNADGRGGSIDKCMMTYQRLALILGTIYLIVDKPAVQARTRADERLPYLAPRLPRQLVMEEKDAVGDWERVVFSETVKNTTQYRIFTRDEWILAANQDGTDIIAQGVHGLGMVPVVKLHIAEPLNPTDTRGQGFFYDLAQLNWDLFNVRSELRELFRAQTFSILALPTLDSAEREKLAGMTISTENALCYNPSGGGQPTFIAPPDGPVKLYMEQVAAIVEDIYRVANLEFVGGVQQSGVALAFHFQEANSSMQSMAQLCEQAENEVARLVYGWMGREFDGSIIYNSDFNLTDLATNLQQAMDAVSLGMGDEFDKALKKQIAHGILGNDVSPSVMQSIDDDIDAMGDEYGDRIRREAGPDRSTGTDTETDEDNEMDEEEDDAV